MAKSKVNLDQKLEIVIDYTDERNRVLNKDHIVETKEDLKRMLRAGVSTPEIAEALVVSQQMGCSKDKFLPSPKTAFKKGEDHYTGVAVRAMRHPYAGRNYSVQVPDFKGPVTQQKAEIKEIDEETNEEIVVAYDYTASDVDPQPDTYAYYTSQLAIQRAEEYLRKMIPAHMEPNFVILHEAGVNVTEIVEFLKSEIDRIVANLK